MECCNEDFYKRFEPEVDAVMNARSEHKAGERELGSDPKTGKPVFVKIGRFGPVVQIGTADDTDKPRFAQFQPTRVWKHSHSKMHWSYLSFHACLVSSKEQTLSLAQDASDLI